MGTFSTEITLKNEVDLADFKRGYITEDKIRQVTVEAVVDTGSEFIGLTEEMLRTLGVDVIAERTARTATGSVPCKITGSMLVLCGNRDASSRGIVIPGLKVPLLGAIALEGMDLMVDPVAKELVGRHGEELSCLAY